MRKLLQTPVMKNNLNVIALGAGVQSSTMAFMAARGEIEPMPDAAIFADVGAEPDEVYDYFDWLEDELPYPVYKVKEKRGLTVEMQDAIEKNERFGTPPLFSLSDTGSKGIVNRQCTSEYKIRPVMRKIKELHGVKKGERMNGKTVDLWMGISLDEIQRMKEARDKWCNHVFPLINKRMRRGDCLEWMKRNGYPEPPRSACVYCPYHSNYEWRKIKTTDPNAWDEAIRVDRLVRNGVKGTRDKLFLHSICQPLDEVDFSNDFDRGQLSFLDECDGLCGL